MEDKYTKMGVYLVASVEGRSFVYMETDDPSQYAVTFYQNDKIYGDVATKIPPEYMTTEAEKTDWYEYMEGVADDIAKLVLKGRGDAFDRAASTSIRAGHTG